MLRQTPSLEAIEIFVAAASGNSFRAVARGLALSPSAVSRRIATLETFLGARLFERLGQSQRLTCAGERYFAAVAPAVQAIQRAGSDIHRDGQRSLTVAVSHSLATGWLMPRIPNAQRALGIDIELLPTRDPEVLRTGLAQIAIWGGMAAAPDFATTQLFEGVAIPVSSPAQAGDGVWSDEDILRRPLLSVQSPKGMWERWFGGLVTLPGLGARDYPTVQMMYEAAAAGSGVALAMPLVSDTYLQSGRLVPVAARCRPIGSAYQVFRLRGGAETGPINRRFESWLASEVRTTVQDFERLAHR